MIKGKTFINARIWRENPKKRKRIIKITGKFLIGHATLFLVSTNNSVLSEIE
jgi:hypothetical protein